LNRGMTQGKKTKVRPAVIASPAPSAIVSPVCSTVNNGKPEAQALSPGPVKKRLVIIGAGFAGIEAADKLCRCFSVTLVDWKDYFEFTPGILRCFVNPNKIKLLCLPLASLNKRVNFVKAEVTNVSPSEVTLKCESEATGLRLLPFDFLIIGSGSSYTAPIKPCSSDHTIALRYQSLCAACKTLKLAKTVLIIGGGLVGVELAAEIVSVYTHKHVIVVHGNASLLQNMQPGAQKYAEKWLRKRGVVINLGVKAQEVSMTGCVLEGGRKIQADVVYDCTGSKPCSGMIPPSMLTKTGHLRVNTHLQHPTWSNVYCVGDVMVHSPSYETKLAYTAELNAKMAACNLRAMVQGERLQEYPSGVIGNDVSPEVFCISLGKFDGVVCFNKLVITGKIAALFKLVIEVTKLSQIQGSFLGRWFWLIADFTAAKLSRFCCMPVRHAKNLSGINEI